MPITAGILAVNKPQGMTSRDAVNIVQRLIKPVKVGHAGTLDPLATGVLVICLGGATRLVPWIQAGHKHYRAGFRLGLTSDTDDITGTVTPGGDPSGLTQAAVELGLQQFVGQIEQVPPQYSAVHVQGQRAYDLARQGITTDLAAKTIEIDSITLTDWNPPDFTVDIRCGSGTYVRSIGRDLGVQLGCGAIMTSLVRTGVGPFTLNECIALDGLDQTQVMSAIRPPRDAVSHLPLVTLNESEVRKLRQGQRWPCMSSVRVGQDYAAVNDTDALVGIITPTTDVPPRWTSQVVLPFDSGDLAN